MNRPLTIGIVVAVFILLFSVERAVSLRRPKARLPARVLVNLSISALAFGASAIFVQPVVDRLIDWTAHTSFGLLPLAGLSGGLELVFGFLLLDLSFYYWHVANHRSPFLWRFHNVHHIDPDLDVSTGFRFHFGEIALSSIFRVVQIGLIGPSLATFLVYELVFLVNTLFHHSNVRLPVNLERLLNKVFVTPRMHGIHHSQVRTELNSNFSVVFSWWDRLHRTLRLNVPQARIVIGVPGYSMPGDNSLWHCLSLPFRAQRDYWRTPDGQLVRRDARLSAAQTRLAE
jgi:sterol desaturase/sphingolipid hydroxylase (fatty acid hydroxylase superfamily)